MTATASVPAAIAVTNLLGRYAECIDTGDFEAAAALFADATLKVGVNPDGPATVDAAGILEQRAASAGAEIGRSSVDKRADAAGPATTI